MEDARKIPNSDWESHKKTIEILYLTENKSLNEVMKTMEESHGFYARKAQYVRKLDQWGFKKNSTHEEWKFVARQLKKRNLEGKRSDTYINGKLIPRKKVMKEVSRYVTSSGQQMPITAPNPAPLSGVEVRTPPGETVEVMDFLHIPWFEFETFAESQFERFCTFGHGISSTILLASDLPEYNFEGSRPIDLPSTMIDPP